VVDLILPPHKTEVAAEEYIKTGSNQKSKLKGPRHFTSEGRKKSKRRIEYESKGVFGINPDSEETKEVSPYHREHFLFLMRWGPQLIRHHRVYSGKLSTFCF
jgi:hypothetical protein